MHTSIDNTSIGDSSIGNASVGNTSISDASIGDALAIGIGHKLLEFKIYTKTQKLAGDAVR
ncbi:hypothetical protein EV426DRAFT_709180 [Tirmania nivea]|nr:hypothetical protein EV426DRAFT_709180 [Tirmania nivea]